jgi:hypothetical protein
MMKRSVNFSQKVEKVEGSPKKMPRHKWNNLKYLSLTLLTLCWNRWSLKKEWEVRCLLKSLQEYPLLRPNSKDSIMDWIIPNLNQLYQNIIAIIMMMTLITSYKREISYIINLELTMHRILNRQNLYGPLLPTTLI